MKKIIIKDLVKKSIKDLVKMRNDFKKELFQLKTQNSIRSLKQTHFITILKRNIARVNTVLSNKIRKNGDNMN